jgi:protein tyrosine phosphatase (PTP) superfamily phosphohydrolase (DUF442 family)
VTSPAFWTGEPLTPVVAAVAAGSWAGQEPPAIRGTGYCVDTVEAALWAVAGAEDFRRAILRAANLGDDADTTAAIAGQIAGARWGASAIPAAWRDRLVAGDRIDSLARRLFAAGGGVDEPVWPYDRLVHAWWVEPDRLLAGEYPGSPDQAKAIEKINVLVDAGIRTFVDLTGAADRLLPYQQILDSTATARGLQLNRPSFPVPDNHVTDDDRATAITDAIEHALTEGPVYVHCWGGVGRTGTIVGCRLADQGLGYEEVLDRLAQLRAGTKKSHRPCPEVAAQREQVRRRVAGRRRSA